MAEEDDEEDCGITIKIDAPSPNVSSIALNKSSKDDNNETPV